MTSRGGICPSRQSRRECKIFASGVNFSIFTHFLCFFLLKRLKLGEIDGVKFLAQKSGGVDFWTNSMSEHTNSTVNLVKVICLENDKASIKPDQYFMKTFAIYRVVNFVL